MMKKTLKELREQMTMKEIVAFALEWGVKVDKKGSKTSAIGKIEAYCPEAILHPNKVVEEQEPVVEEPAVEVKEPEPVVEVEEPTVEEQEPVVEEPKAKKARKPLKLNNEVVALLKNIRDTWEAAGGTIRYPDQENARFNALCAENGRQVLKLMWTRKKVSLYSRVAAAVDFAEDWQKINYALPYQCIFYENTAENFDNICNLIEMVMDADSERTKKAKKAVKKQ